MENKTNKRAGIGQKPRGRQETRGVEALSVEKPVASNEGQEEGAKDPVSEPADRVQEGGGLLEEISTISHKTEEIEKMPSVSVSEGQSLEEMLAQSHDQLQAENPLRTIHGGAVRRMTPEEEQAFQQQAEARAVRNEPITGRTLTEGELDAIPKMSLSGTLELREATPEEVGAFNRWKDLKLHPMNARLGEQPDGSFLVAVRLEEGYIEPVRQWAESEGITVEEWCSRQLSHYLETWGQPAKGR